MGYNLIRTTAAAAAGVQTSSRGKSVSPRRANTCWHRGRHSRRRRFRSTNGWRVVGRCWHKSPTLKSPTAPAASNPANSNGAATATNSCKNPARSSPAPHADLNSGQSSVITATVPFVTACNCGLIWRQRRKQRFPTPFFSSRFRPFFSPFAFRRVRVAPDPEITPRFPRLPSAALLLCFDLPCGFPGQNDTAQPIAQMNINATNNRAACANRCRSALPPFGRIPTASHTSRITPEHSAKHQSANHAIDKQHDGRRRHKPRNDAGRYRKNNDEHQVQRERPGGSIRSIVGTQNATTTARPIRNHAISDALRPFRPMMTYSFASKLMLRFF